MIAYRGGTETGLPESDVTIDLGYLSGGNDGANGSSGWERASRAAARKSRATDLIAPSR